jgi:aryl carrier-like protein
VVGELGISGLGLAKGYLNESETKKKFVSLKIGENMEAVDVYLTGDLARLNQRGQLELLGRADNQIKLNGRRIEAGEIEQTLQKNFKIAQAIVKLNHFNEKQHLTAYLVQKDLSPFNQNEIRQFLKEHLPSFMIPSAFVLIDKIPLSQNGKIDYKSLPDLNESHFFIKQIEIPQIQSSNELILYEIWKKVLKINNFGLNENFFQIGGDSIMCIKIISALREKGLLCSINDLFTCPTIKQLASKLNNLKPSLNKIREEFGRCELIPIQEWFFQFHKANLNHWNQSVWLRLKSAVAINEFVDSLISLFNTHKILHSSFEFSDQKWYLNIKNSKMNKSDFFKNHFDFINLEQILSQNQKETFLNEKSLDLNSSLNITDGKLVKILGLKFKDESDLRVLIVCHHLIIDAVSYRILLEDLNQALYCIKSQKEIQLEKSDSFKLWSMALNEVKYFNDEEIRFWSNQLKMVNLDYKFFNFDKKDFLTDFQVFSHRFDKKFTNDFSSGLRKSGIDFDEAFIAAFSLSLYGLFKKESLSLMIESHGRHSSLNDNSRTIGWYTAEYPILFFFDEVPGNEANKIKSILESISKQLRQVKKESLINYGVLRHLLKRTDICELDEPLVSFNNLGNFFQPN